MARNPLRRKSKLEKAQEQARKAADQAQRTAEQASERAAELRALAEPQVAKAARSRPWLLGAGVIAAIAVVATVARKLRGSSPPPADVPSPGSVSSTAPAGPTDDRLNDPALKSKVESELFRDEAVPKERISIDVADGVVTLRGQLDSADEATEISTRAGGIEGVRRVENLLSATGSS